FVALHGIPDEAAGTVLVRKGTMLVASTGMHIRVSGRTSHAAEPESGNSPWSFLKRMADEALMMPSVGMKLHNRSKVTLVGLKTGGPHFGTSPGKGDLWLTIRAYTTETLEEMVQSLTDKAVKVAKSEDLQVEVTLHEHFEATMNDEEMVDIFVQICKDAGIETKSLEHPFSYSEDFGRFTSVALSLFLGLGVGKDLPALHASNYDFPDDLIPAGINLYDIIIRHYHS
ncbi:MAG: M20/M25/M40 family metallo-hydrolase, partial [Balneolales bacterium]|nr:M20/M25/M40 family metallo-hydrolase [Balneolales bacterium]